MRKHGFIAAILAVVLMAGFTAGVIADDQPAAGGRRPHAGPGPGGPGGPGGRGGPGGIGFPGLGALDLTDAQREQVRTITQAHRDEMRQIAERVQQAQRAIDEAANGATVDEAGIRARSTELAAALADGAILRGRVHAQIIAVLTPEQQQKLQEQRTQMQERMKPRGDRRPARPGR